MLGAGYGQLVLFRGAFFVQNVHHPVGNEGVFLAVDEQCGRVRAGNGFHGAALFEIPFQKQVGVKVGRRQEGECRQMEDIADLLAEFLPSGSKAAVRNGAFYVGTQSGARRGISNKVDGKLYRIDKFTHHCLTVILFTNGLILQAP